MSLVHCPVESLRRVDEAARTFVFIESNTTGTGRLCLEKALLRGFRVLFLTRRPQLYGFLRDETVEPVVTDTSDVDSLEALIRAQPDVVGVFSTSEYFIETAAIVARRLGLPSSAAEAIGLCRDKGRLYERLRAAGVATADTHIVETLEQLRALAPALHYPLVLKPAMGSGSVGVRLVRGEADLFEHGAAILSGTRNERGIAVVPKLLLQQYIDGPEFSVEVVGLGPDAGYRVLGVTGKHLGALPHFVETGHDFPAPVDDSLRKRIAAEALSGLQAVGHVFGPAHVECRLRGDRVVIIEINPRLAGGMIPQAIEHATGIDVLGAMIDLFSGADPDLAPRRDDVASIRFLLPPHDGTLRALGFEPLVKSAGVRAVFTALKPVGQRISLKGDFTDRVALVLASGPDRDALNRALEEARLCVEMTVDDGTPVPSAIGRLRSALHPKAMEIIRKHEGVVARLADLESFVAIDEAHLLMLSDTGICGRSTVVAALRHVSALRQEGFPVILEAVAPRGAYSLYEQALIERAGIDVGGAVHTARSRNDINACISKLQVRDTYVACYRALWRMRSALIEKAETTLDWPLPVYSQYQAAQPGSFGYYLWSVETALRRDQSALSHLEDDLAVCPMGAGSGAGSDFPIDPRIVADLLGFRGCAQSALDAVASRDLILRLLGALSIAATTLSRLAHDLQLWTMRETAFLELPDELSGGSSLMPQKKNPYLLEIAKGKFAQVAGAAGTTLFSMQRTPFGNSIEVGTEAVSMCGDAALAFEEACDLLRLMVEGVSGDRARMCEAADEGVVVATQVANRIVREQGITFHEAHLRVGGAITDAIKRRQDPSDALAALAGGRHIDAASAAADLRFGGGPGAVAGALAPARERLREDAHRLSKLRAGWAAAQRARRHRVENTIAGVE
ncbi:MAG: ATP-grasp domain-containing protein [Pseudomonadota bacterium]|nr:ATP-grasp domain-containing protein [Pseudomonadota bacterium]